MPSKNEVWSARIAYLARHAAQFGTMTGAVTTDMAKVRQRKRDMVEREIAAHLANFRSSGAELIMGSGRFVAPKTLEVQMNDGGTRRLTGDQVFLNIGSHAAIPSIPGLTAARPLTHIEALELDYAPSHLIVLGAGYVGLELAQAYRRFGSRVTVIEAGPQIMGREDPDIAEAMHRILSEEGIQFVLSAEPVAVRGRSGDGVSLTARTPPASRRSRPATSWSRPGAFRTPPASAWRRPASRWMRAAIFASTSGWRRRRPMSGQSGNVLAARSSRTYRSMISASSATIWPAARAARATGWCRIACSPIRRSRMSD